MAEQFAGIVYNCNFQINSSHRLNFQCLSQAILQDKQSLNMLSSDFQFPIALDIKNANIVMQICVQFDDPRASERVTAVSTFSVPLTDDFSEVHMRPEETVVLLAKLLSCQQDVLAYKYYLAKATQALMGSV